MRKILLGVCFLLTAAGCSDETNTNPNNPPQNNPPNNNPPNNNPPTGQLPDPCRGTALPTDRHFVAQGLCARAVATQVEKMRQLTFAPNGDLFGVTLAGKIIRFRDANGNGGFEGGERSEYGETDGDSGNNVHIDGNYLYAGGATKVKRFGYDPTQDEGGDGQDVVTDLPSGGRHPLHTVHVYDGWLYVHSGSEQNVVAPASPNYDPNRALIKRFDLSKLESMGRPYTWGDGEVFADGLRNTVGFTRSAARRIYAVNNGIDNLRYGNMDIHQNNPGDELFLIEGGKSYGYPYCFTVANSMGISTPIPAIPGTLLAGQATNDGAPMVPAFTNPHDDLWCGLNATRPTSYFPAHSAPLDIAIYDQGPEGGLPQRYRGGAFVTLHGSWNRDVPTGFKVMFVQLDANGSCPLTGCQQEVVFGGGTQGGAVDGPWSWETSTAAETLVRPVGVAISPVDGALYVSSDNAEVIGRETTATNSGAIYRIGQQR